MTNLLKNWASLIIRYRPLSATGATHGRGYRYTYSELAQRLLPGLLLAAFPSKPMCGALSLAEPLNRVRRLPELFLGQVGTVSTHKNHLKMRFWADALAHGKERSSRHFGSMENEPSE